MWSSSSLLSEENLLCSICLDVFTDPISTPCGHNYCRKCITHYWDSKGVCECPICRETFRKRQKFSVNRVLSEMADQCRRHKLKEEFERKTEAEVQQTIQERQVKIQEVKHSVVLSRKDADRVMAESRQVFAALIRCIESIQAELNDVIEEKQKTTEKQAEGFVKELQQEITRLERRISELKQVSHTEDHLQLLQNFTSINNPPPTKDWTKVNVHWSPYVGTVRTAVAQLEKTLSKEMEKLRDAELREVQQYAVDVTLDPDTAHPCLILSADGKQVSAGNAKKNLPQNNNRFSKYVCVLGKQNISSGRFYYEVQVKRKNDWIIGVARESINRKDLLVGPYYGFWTIRRDGSEYRALAGTCVLLPVREELQTVGVFVDYEEGLVSFYDVEARVHLYSYTGCSFTEKLFPFFSPGPNDGGRNSAPLIISPVNVD